MSDGGADSLQQAAARLARVLAPLVAPFAANDPAGAGIVQLVHDLGWTLPGPPPPSLAALRAEIVAVATDATALEAALARYEATGAAGDAAAAIAAVIAVATDVFQLATALGQLPAQLTAELPAPYVAATALPSQLASRVVDALIIDAALRGGSIGARVLQLLGVFERRPVPADPAKFQPAFLLRQIHWDRIGGLIAHPAQVLGDVYGWGSPALDLEPLFAAVQALAHAIGAPGTFGTPPRALLDAIAPGVAVPARGPDEVFQIPLIDLGAAGRLTAAVTPVPAAPGALPGLAVVLEAQGLSGVAVPLGRHVSLMLETPVDAAAGVALILHPDRAPDIATNVAGGGAALAQGALSLHVDYARDADEPPVTIFSIPGGSRVEIRGAYLGIGVAAAQGGSTDASIEGGIRQARLVLDVSGVDSFLASLLPASGISFDFELGVGWSRARGVYLRGDAGLEATIPLHAAIGPLSLEALTVGAQVTGDGVGLDLGVTGSGTLGPLTATVEGIGMTAALAFHAGNLGPVDLGLAFKPPDGLGIAVDAGPITGGGFLRFEPDRGRYSGVLQLDVFGVAVTAIGLLDTRLPGREEGFSFLILITVEFTPIQLGFGFTLDGVGGLCGIHRTVAADALRAAVLDHSLDHILFPHDAIANAPAIINDLRTIFPPAEGQYVFCPMAILGWGTPTLIEAQLGILIELPDPVRIGILGSLSVYLPYRDAPLVELHADIAGLIDFGAQELSIDASLHDSRVVLFALSGDMAMRLLWGDQPSFAMSFGGFHPHFQAPPGFPSLQRLALCVTFLDVFKLSSQSYLAVTSNTLQIGTRTELTASVGDFNVLGWTGYDALFQWQPFRFDADVSCGIELRWGSHDLAGVHLDGHLQGPAPWDIDGEASVSILFFDISVHVHFRFGDEAHDDVGPTQVWGLLAAAIADPHSWSAELPPGAVSPVVLAPPEGTNAPVLVDPVGSAVLREKVVPLDRPISRFGATRPDREHFDITSVTVGGDAADYAPVQDYFARAQFVELTDDEKLSAPSFELMDAGIRLADDALRVGTVIGDAIEYETTIVDSPWQDRPAPPYQLTLARQLALGQISAAAQAAWRRVGLAKYAVAGAPRVVLDEPSYVIATTDTLSPSTELGAFASKGEALDRLAAHLAAHPEAGGRLQVVAAHDVTGTPP